MIYDISSDDTPGQNSGPTRSVVGRVYERKVWAYRIGTLARERVLKHSRATPGRTFVAVAHGIGEVARAKDGM